MPLSIRFVANALEPHFGELENALSSAMRRALAHSREVVLKNNPDAVVVLNPATFRWSNRALDRLPLDERLRLQSLIQKICGELCASEGITDRRRQDGKVIANAAVGEAGASDSVSVHAAGSGKKASKAGHGKSHVKPPGVKIISFSDEEAAAHDDVDDEDDDSSDAPTYYDPTELTEADIPAFLVAPPAMTEQFYDYAQPGRDFIEDFRNKTVEVLGSFPTSGYLGALALRNGHLWIRVYELSNGNFVAEAALSGQALTAGGLHALSAEQISPHARYEITWFQDAETPLLWKRVVFSYFKETVRVYLRDVVHKPHTDQDVHALTDLMVDKAQLASTVVGFSRFHINKSKGILMAQSSAWPKETFRVIPLAFLAPTPLKETPETEARDKSGMRPCCSEPVKIPSVTIDGQDHDWGPFECEAPLYQLGRNGDYMRDLIKAIATKLSIPECEYPGRFCIEATIVIGFRQAKAGALALDDQGEMRLVPGGTGNLGAVDFKPVATVSIQLLRELAGIIPDIAHLDLQVQMTYGVKEYADLLGHWYTGQGASWRLQFIPAMSDAMNEAIGGMFLTGCFSVVMQLFRVSHKGIADRMGNQKYAEQFEILIRNEILPLEYLKRLRDQLSPWVPKSAGAAVAEAAVQTWQQARDSVRQLFETRNPFGDLTRGIPGEIKPDGDTFKIVDSSGTKWSIQDLDAEIALRTSISEGIDPLLTQITSDSEILNRFARNSNDIKGELATLLKEMLSANEEKVNDIKDDPFDAFGATKIYEADERFHGTAGSGYDLTGVHKQVNDLIGDAFRNEPFYRDAVKALFDSVEGARSLAGAFEFAGIVLLCVTCAPLGVAAGIASATYHEHEVLEEQKLFRGLINPELVMTRAELETDLFCAELGLALSIIPEGGKIAEGILSGGKTLLKQELKAAITALGESAAKAIAKELIEKIEKGILSQFVTEFVKAEVMNQFIGRLVIGPIAGRINADFQKTLEAKAVLKEK